MTEGSSSRRRRSAGVALTVAVVLATGAVAVVSTAGPGWRSVEGEPVAAPATTTATVAQPREREPVAAGSEREIVSDNGKVRLTVPSSWSPSPEEDSDASLSVGDPVDGHFVVVVSDNPAHFPSFAEFDRIVSDFAITEHLEDFKLKKRRERTVGGKQAVEYHYTGTYEGVKFVYWHVTVNAKKGYHQVIGWTQPSHAKAAEPVITGVIDSFREVG